LLESSQRFCFGVGCRRRLLRSVAAGTVEEWGEDFTAAAWEADSTAVEAFMLAGMAIALAMELWVLIVAAVTMPDADITDTGAAMGTVGAAVMAGMVVTVGPVRVGLSAVWLGLGFRLWLAVLGLGMGLPVRLQLHSVLRSVPLRQFLPQRLSAGIHLYAQ
jgi:hypothetical protein